MADKILYLVFGAVVGAWALQSFGPSDFVAYPEVIVPAARIIEREPPARPPTIVERLRFITPPPVQLARAPGGADGYITGFCSPLIEQRTDTLEVLVPDPQLLLRSGTWSESWWGKDELRLTGPTNAGDLLEYTYRTRGSYDFTVDGDSVLVRYGRFSAVRDGIDLGARAWALFSLLRAGTEMLR